MEPHEHIEQLDLKESKKRKHTMAVYALNVAVVVLLLIIGYFSYAFVARNVSPSAEEKTQTKSPKIIQLDVRKGESLRGNLTEIENQPFDWYVVDETDMIFFKQDNRQYFDLLDEGHDEPAYQIDAKIPHLARWYLILDMYGLKNDRTVHVDFEPITPQPK